MSRSLTNGSDEYYRLVDAIDQIYQMSPSYDREEAVKQMRSHIILTYGDDPVANWLLEYNLKYY